MTRFLPLILILLLAGCATHPAKRAPMNSVPAARRFESKLLRPSAKRNCALTLVREAGVKGYGLNVYLDGELAARISAGEMITLFVRPGKHQLSAHPLFSPAIGKRLRLEKGERVVVRIIDRNGNFEFKIAEPAWLQSIGQTFQSQVWDPLSRTISATDSGR